MKSTILSIDLAGIESGRVALKAPPITLDPPTVVKAVKVIPPVEVKATAVPGISLNIIISGEPGHASRIEAMAPGIEGRRPKVHHEHLLLVQERDISCVFSPAGLVAINEPRDVVWGPLDSVLMPVGAWLEATNV